MKLNLNSKKVVQDKSLKKKRKPKPEVKVLPKSGRKDEIMPKGSKVHKVYTALRKIGSSKGKAARIAQSQSGQSLKTGKPPKKKK